MQGQDPENPIVDDPTLDLEIEFIENEDDRPVTTRTTPPQAVSATAEPAAVELDAAASQPAPPPKDTPNTESAPRKNAPPRRSGPPPRPYTESELQVFTRRALQAHNANKLTEAEQLYNRILMSNPDFAPAWVNLGTLLRRTGRHLAAVTHLKRGVLLSHKDGAAWSNLGNALRNLNRLDEAIAAQKRALDVSPELARIHYNFGLAMRDKGDLDAAFHAMRRAELLGYSAPELAWDISLTHLLAGDLKQGFETYESRWNLPQTRKRHQDVPEWDGSPLNDRTLLVWAEQGLGDTIHFCRYLGEMEEPPEALDGKKYRNP